jgi:SRSO17 transposase
VIDGSATARVERLVRWLEQFKRCFGHRAQLLALRTYVHGVFSDSDRKSMQAMRARVTEPVSYQAFQHFITHAPWDAARVWRRLRAIIPERRGVLILDGTSFPKQGPHSVGVARQYCGALGKIANCQVATTVALWTGVRAWFLGAILYLPEEWLTAERRLTARIPAPLHFQQKWRHALTLLRQVRAAGFTLTAVIGDAEFGDVSRVRIALHRLKLPYALGISSNLVVFVRRPHRRAPPPQPGAGRPRTRARLVDGSPAESVRALAHRLPAAAWRPAAGRCVAAHHVAQRRATGAPRALRGPARDTRPRLAWGAPRPRGVAALRTRGGARRAPQVLLHSSPGHRVVAHPRRAGASAVGD